MTAAFVSRGLRLTQGRVASFLASGVENASVLKQVPEGVGMGVYVYLAGRAPKHLPWTGHLCESGLEPARSPFPSKILSYLLNINTNQPLSAGLNP